MRSETVDSGGVVLALRVYEPTGPTTASVVIGGAMGVLAALWWEPATQVWQWQSVSASSWSCVTKMVVIPTSRWMRRSSTCISLRNALSRAARRHATYARVSAARLRAGHQIRVAYSKRYAARRWWAPVLI